MRRPRLPSLTYANVTASLALFIALGGTSYAVTQLPRNSVGTPQLRSNAVSTPKLKNGAVTADKLAPGALLRGPRGAAGPAGSNGTNGRDGLSQARIVTPDSVTLSPNQFVPVNVARMAGVAAGSYLALYTGRAEVRSAAIGEYVICEMRVNGVRVASTRAIVGDAFGGDAGVTISAPIVRGQDFDLTVACWADQSHATVPWVGEHALTVISLDKVTLG